MRDKKELLLLQWTWNSMKQRCFNPSCRQYKHYGGRGITVCDRWLVFKNFAADIGERPPGMTIDRIDNDGPYSPENFRWATRAQQSRNRRGLVNLTYDGKTMTVEEWGRFLGRHPTTLRSRIRMGHSLEKILSPSLHLPSQNPKARQPRKQRTEDDVRRIVREELQRKKP